MTPTTAVSVKKAIRVLQRFEGVVEDAAEDELADAAARADATGLFNCPHTGVALAASMVLAALYGARSYLTIGWLDIPSMRVLHGTTNAFGFALCGLCGWRMALRGKQATGT